MLKHLTTVAFVLGMPTLGYAAASTRDFVSKAAISNMYEIETSKLALKNASKDEVKAFAQKMIDDHTKAGEELKGTLAGADEESAPQVLDATHKASLDALAKKAGADFDKGYIAEQKNAHDDAVELFTDYSTTGDEANLKAFATKTLPTLRAHQQQVQRLFTSATSTTQAAKPAVQNATLVEGRNSFTEEQARDRLAGAGYASIEGLAKDEKGIWRGKATKDGRSVEVGLDFKGNIAAH